MQPYEEILKDGIAGVAGSWLRMCEDCKGTQERVFKDILANASNSRFGIDHDFSGISDVEGYRERVSISEYHNIEDLVEHIAATGAEDVLYNGPTVFMTSTSGTTGKNKLIPESARGQKAKDNVVVTRGSMLARALMEKFTSKGAQMDPGSMPKLRMFSLAFQIPNSVTPGGIEVGFASGRTMDSFESSVNLAYPSIIMGLKDNGAAMYLSMLFALMHDDVSIITGNNVVRMLSRITLAQECAETIIRDMREGRIDPSLNLTPEERSVLETAFEPNPKRADELQALLDKGREFFIPKYYWPRLFAVEFWLAGSVGVNVDRIRPLLGDVVYFDVGYGASEAKINIPVEAGVGYGPLATFAAFYEFIPVGSNDILTADQLEDGGEYEIILTTYSGLYRYNIKDIVKVRGFTGNTPNIEFLTKSREILNISQEKIPAPALLESIYDYMGSKGAVVRQAQVWPDDRDRCYHLFLELESNEDMGSLDLDAHIHSAFPMYGRMRDFGALESARTFLMRKGWQEHLFEIRMASGAPVSQIKLDALAKTRPEDDWIIKEIR